MSEQPETDKPYCLECGGERLAYVDQYADSQEWRCLECGARVVSSRREREDEAAKEAK